MLRSQLIPHPKNPRIIDKDAKKRLKGKVKGVGLLENPIWNERTGYVVGGHQRLAIMDELEGYPGKVKDYELMVNVVNLDDKTELEMLAFLNNPSAQGEFNVQAVADLVLTDGVAFEDMGFSEFDVDYMFDGDGRFSELFKDTTDVSEAKDSLRKIKEHRTEAKEKMAVEDSAEFYFTVVCGTEAEKDDIMAKIGAPKFERFIHGEMISRRLKEIDE